MKLGDKMVKIQLFESPLYVDGSCDQHNTKCGGFAVIQAEWDDSHTRDDENIIACGARENTTNNEMELTGIYMAVKWIHGRGIEIPQEIRSDSQYAINCVTNWYKNWQKNGWKTSSGKPVQNRELIQKIVRLLEQHDNITFSHVKGHADDEWNEFADIVANDCRAAIENGVEIPDRDEFPDREEEGGENSPLHILHEIEIDDKYIIAVKTIDVEMIKNLKNMGFKSIEISGIWKENFGLNKGEYIEIICKRE